MAWKLLGIAALAAFVPPVFSQVAPCVPPACASATASSAPAPGDAARSVPSSIEDPRSRGSGRGFGTPPPPNIRIHGDGIALPRGVGQGRDGQSGKEDARDVEKDKRDAPTASCVGPNKEGEGCREKESDPVARRIDQGLERDPNAAKPVDVKVRETGIQIPRCFGESRDGVNC